MIVLYIEDKICLEVTDFLGGQAETIGSKNNHDLNFQHAFLYTRYCSS